MLGSKRVHIPVHRVTETVLRIAFDLAQNGYILPQRHLVSVGILPETRAVTR
jgi:hypothetical protein